MNSTGERNICKELPFLSSQASGYSPVWSIKTLIWSLLNMYSFFWIPRKCWNIMTQQFVTISENQNAQETFDR